jgi:hypothetical protein
MSGHHRVLISLNLILFSFLFTESHAQKSADVKKIFTQAESYFIFEEYELANQLYLLIETPDNMNIKHKIGTCYLNIPGEKEKSMPYLEEAVKNSSFNSKTESLKEKRAPLDAYFSLAKAYMINNEFEKALNTLQQFSNLTNENKTAAEMENMEFVDQQIQACRNAIKFRQVPILFEKESLGPDFSLGSINENPAVSYDGKTIVYTERRGLENAIFYSRKENGKWRPPVEITQELNAGTDCSSTGLNSDGTELYLYKTENYDGSIYSSTYSNGVWSPIKKLNKNINTKYYESHASVSADGKRLYFSSNREGGFGNLDIYVSELDQTGNWGPAVNLGSEINTPFNEDTPFITKNDSMLYFSSEGHNSMGGFDNYKSQRTATGWKTPSNLGFPINSADDDKFFQPVNNGINAYYSITTGYKKKEIFYLDLQSRDLNRPYIISGIVTYNTSRDSSVKSEIRFVNKVSGDTLYTCYADSLTGEYSMNVAPGLFRIFYSGKGYLSQSVDTLVVQDSPEMNININVKLLKDTVIHVAEPVKYEKIDLGKIPVVASIDSSILIKNLTVTDESDKKVSDEEVLYYTVQVIALHKPVDISYFKYITDMKVMYNEKDKFYRYTTGNYTGKEDAYKHRSELIAKGYPKQIFVKKISKSEK